jgi:hypothetical protein
VSVLENMVSDNLFLQNRSRELFPSEEAVTLIVRYLESLRLDVLEMGRGSIAANLCFAHLSVRPSKTYRTADCSTLLLQAAKGLGAFGRLQVPAHQKPSSSCLSIMRIRA